MKPACHNRAPYTDPKAGWVQVRSSKGKGAYGYPVMTASGLMAWMSCDKVVLRYRWPWFTDRCTVHDVADIGPGQTYAQAHGWDCTGCRWLPEVVR